MITTLEGKSALITGASRGIGKAVAAKFVDAGCTVHLAARDEAALARLHSTDTRIAAGNVCAR